MLKDLSLVQWFAIAAGILFVLHSLGVYDITKLPVVGQLLAKLVKPHTPTSPNAPVSPIVTPATDTDNLVQDQRCEALKVNLLALRHFASERPTEKASQLLTACDTLQAELEVYHKEHAT
jgi:hypothetical protein